MCILKLNDSKQIMPAQHKAATDTKRPAMTNIKSLLIEQFLAGIAAKTPAPGGGAAAEVGASVGSAAAAMAAAYTRRKKDRDESGAAARADELVTALDVAPLLKAADDDAKVYADLQRTWREVGMPAEEKTAIEGRALSIPTKLVESCHDKIVRIRGFLPHCKENVTSDAKLGIHVLGPRLPGERIVLQIVVISIVNIMSKYSDIVPHIFE